MAALAPGLTAEAKDKKDALHFPPEVVERETAAKLPPLRPWNIDFAENRCRLSRLFGTEEEPHLIFFEQTAPGARFGLTFAGSQLKRFARADDVSLGAERDKPIEPIDRFYRGDVTGIGPAIIIADYRIGRSVETSVGAKDKGDETRRLSKAGIDLDEATTIDRFVLAREDDVVSFETGDMIPAFQALNVCTSDLLRSWGLDPDEHQAYRSPVWTNRISISKRIARYYPLDALNRGEMGVFRMRVIVEKDGAASDCFLEASTENARLEPPACREMRRAKFEPARDAQGQPIRSFYSTSITYQISR
ncbi:MAG: TonB family protein [Pseudomonadota bacterium]